MIMNKIVIDPVTRIEGHGKVTIHLDENNKVKEYFFITAKLRSFDRCIQ